MRICFVAILLTACGNDTAKETVDAALSIDAPPDAPPVCPGELTQCSGTCINTRTDDDHCGSCSNNCVTAARCAASACACPAPFLGNATHPVLATSMLATQPGFVSGAAGLTGSDSASHAVIITAAVTAPLNTPLAVNVNNQVFAAISYELVTTTQARSAFLATSGTVTLTRRCAFGIAGTLANVTLVEIDAMTLQQIPGGCTTTVAALPFNIAGACP